MQTPCKFRWNGPAINLANPNGGATLGVVQAGQEGVLVYPGLAAFSPDLALLYRVDESHLEIEATSPSRAEGLCGWDGQTVTPALVKALLEQDDAIPTLVEVLNDNPDLGPRVIQGVMAGMGG